MNKLKLICSIAGCMLISGAAAQNGIFWCSSVTFDLGSSMAVSEKTIPAIPPEFYINKALINDHCHAHLKNKAPGTYLFSFSCSAIGGSGPDSIKCPNVYLKITLRSDDKQGVVTKWVPFIFDAAAGSFQQLVIRKIDLKELLAEKDPAVYVNSAGAYTIIANAILEIPVNALEQVATDPVH